MRRWSVLAVLVLAACSESGGIVSAADQLSVAVEPGDGSSRNAALSCGETPAGTGWLADGEAAAAACAVVESGRARLVDGPPADQVCTQQYGGPDVARVTGSIGDAAVDTEFNRANGCGIAEWATFEPLLGPPSNVTGGY